jgi:hypothetical protein
MNGIAPVVRLMLLCEHAESTPTTPNRWNVYGLMHSVRLADDATFPARLDLLTVLLHLTGGRGTGQASIVGVHADSGERVFGAPSRPIQFGTNPLAVQGLLFRILDVPFPQPGLYWIQFLFNDQVIAQQPLLVR